MFSYLVGDKCREIPLKIFVMSRVPQKSTEIEKVVLYFETLLFYFTQIF